MVRILVSLASLVALVGLGDAQAYDIRHDSDLKGAVTLSEKYGPVREVLKSLGKQAGVSLSAAMSVSDLKVTVFVKDVPCNVVLERIGSVLDCQWKNDEGNRLLTTSTADAKEVANYLDQEDIEQRKRAEDQLDRLLGRQNQSTSDNTPPAADTGQPVEAAPLRRFRRGLPAGGNAALMQGITQLFSNASSSEMDSFWAGTVAHVDIPDSTPPSSPDEPLRPGRSRLQGSSSNVTVAYARYDYYGTHDLQFGTSRSPVAPQRFVVPGMTQPSATLATTPYGKKLLAWSDMNMGDKDTVFTTPLPPDPEKKVSFKLKPVGGDPDQASFVQRTQSELLETLAKQSGIPIVSDGFRISLNPEMQDPDGATPIAWLKSLASNFGAFVQIRDGEATVRQGGFWRLRQYEIPEDSLRDLEKDPSSLSLLDYAKFFSGLSPAQARSFASENPPKVNFPVDSIIPSIPALRVIGALPSSFPTDGRPVPVSELGNEVESLITQAIAESVFSGDPWAAKTNGKRLPLYLSLQQANVSAPEGTVSGVTLQLGLPIGQVVDFSIPLKMNS